MGSGLHTRPDNMEPSNHNSVQSLCKTAHSSCSRSSTGHATPVPRPTCTCIDYISKEENWRMAGIKGVHATLWDKNSIILPVSPSPSQLFYLGASSTSG